MRIKNSMLKELSVLVAMLLLFTAGISEGTTLLSDKFDTYSVGNVFPAGGWAWTATSGTYTPMWTVQSSMTYPTASARSAPNVARFYSFIIPNGQSGRLYRTTGVDLSGYGSVPVTLEFYMYHYTGAGSDSMQVSICTDGVNWTQIGPVIQRNDGSTGWKLHTLDLSAYTGAGFSNVRIGFHGVSNYGYNIFLDDVTITCPGPDLMYVSNSVVAETCALGGPGQNNGLIDPGETVSLNVDLKSSGTASATGISATLSSTTPGITIGTPASGYTDLAAGNTGINNTPFRFTVDRSVAAGTIIDFNLHVTAAGGGNWDFPFTRIVGKTIILSEDFSGATVPNPPAGWIFPTPSQANPWTTNASGCTGYGMRTTYNTTQATDAWAYSPALSLTAGVTYTLSFKQKTMSATYPENLSVWYGETASPASQINAIWSGTGLTNTACTERIGSFTVPSTGTYYIGFHGTSAANMYYLTVDDIVLLEESGMACYRETTSTITSSSNPSTNGQTVTFTDTVTSTAGTPTGTVAFKTGGSNIAGCGAQALNAGGSATCVVSTLPEGFHGVTAVYSGDTNYAASIGVLAPDQQVVPTFGVAAIIVDQSTPSILYSAQDGGGIWKSTNNGAAWTKAATQPSNNRIKGFVRNPSDNTVFYAATYGGGMFKSTDSAGNWTSCANTGLAGAGQNAVSLAIDSTGRLYAGTEAGIFTSSDCTSWSAVNSGLTVDAAKPPVAIAVDPANSANLCAGLDGAGVFRSSNGGVSWTAATTQPSDLRVKGLVLKPEDSTKQFVATYGGGVFTSVNSGVDWSACGAQPTNLNTLSLTIDGSGKLYTGTESGVFVSTDGCATWTMINSGLP